MGHKVHPIGFRLGVVKGWQSRWYAERDYKELLAEDLKIRSTIQKELANAAVSHIEIERAAANQVTVTIHTAKPGIVIGKSGEKVDKLRSTLEAQTRKRVRLNIVEIRQPELDAYLVGRSIAEQLEKRVSFRRAMKQAVQKTMRANAKGIRVVVGGRLGGAEIARTEKEVEGKIPLHTLRADIDYGLAEAHTAFGVIGIKVWIYKGDILPSKRREPGELQEAGAQPAFTPRERTEGGERRGERRAPRGERGGERAPRGERPQGQAGERAPRSERSGRPQGERPPRPQGERAPRPQGERPPRAERSQAQGGERAPRPPRAQGERPARPQGERPPRGSRTGSTEQAPQSQPTAAAPEAAPEAQAASAVQEPQVQEVQGTETQAAAMPPAPPATPEEGAGSAE